MSSQARFSSRILSEKYGEIIGMFTKKYKSIKKLFHQKRWPIRATSSSTEKTWADARSNTYPLPNYTKFDYFY